MRIRLIEISVHLSLIMTMKIAILMRDLIQPLIERSREDMKQNSDAARQRHQCAGYLSLYILNNINTYYICTTIIIMCTNVMLI